MTDARWIHIRNAALELRELGEKIAYSLPTLDVLGPELFEAQNCLDDIRYWIQDIKVKKAEEALQ